jgi:hypothetical protein
LVQFKLNTSPVSNNVTRYLIYLNFSVTAEVWKNGRLILLRTVAAKWHFKQLTVVPFRYAAFKNPEDGG